MLNNNNSSAKYAFLYLLSLAALILTGLSVGMVIFQIINKFIPDPIDQFRASFDTGALRFAISALIVAAPIFFVISRFIYKALYKGKLDKDSGIRKWLTYFILLVSSVVILGWFIGLINSYLGGELTIKFALKAIASIIISGLGFSFYLYDIRRPNVIGIKDSLISFFFYLSLVLVISAFIFGLVLGESPAEARNKKLDNAVINDFISIENAINRYYQAESKLPDNLSVLQQGDSVINQKALIDPEIGQAYEYSIINSERYELCADFRTSNLEEDSDLSNFYKEEWPHNQGRQCIGKNIEHPKELLTPSPVF
ncbi:MAG: DUF5671 domain-containing protein [Patescibacteria group bacterium]|nr:hypothetical protein [Patescibacteria group bacterium]